MQQIQVELGERSYPIYIGQDLLLNSELLSHNLTGRKVLIVTNSTIAPLYLNKVIGVLSTAVSIKSISLPDGEKFKDLLHLDLIFNALLEKRPISS